jgi:hypothetical protein
MSPTHRILADPYCDIVDTERKPRENSILGKNPLKYTTANKVQQSNCRWHCEPTFFLRWAFNKEKSLHTPHL